MSKGERRPGEEDISFSGTSKHWIVQVDGEGVSTQFASAAEIIAEDLVASVNHGRPSVVYGSKGAPHSTFIQGAADYIAGFGPATKATKLILSTGVTHIIPRPKNVR